MALILNEESVNAINQLSSVSRCPICDGNDVNIRMLTMTACGHYACDQCVKDHINDTNKCYKCFERNRPNDIKPDPYITTLVQSVAKLSRMANAANKTDESDDNDSQYLPKLKTKSAPKSEMRLLIDSLVKGCSAKKTAVKEKENTKPIASTIGKQKMNKKTKAQEVIELSDSQSVTSLDVIPDSYEPTFTSYSASNSYNAPKKTFEEKSVEANIVNEKPVMIEKSIQSVPKHLSKHTQCDVDKTDAISQTVTELAKISTNCHENECCLHKNLAKILELRLCPTLDSILSALIAGSKQSECSVDGNVKKQKTEAMRGQFARRGRSEAAKTGKRSLPMKTESIIEPNLDVDSTKVDSNKNKRSKAKMNSNKSAIEFDESSSESVDNESESKRKTATRNVSAKSERKVLPRNSAQQPQVKRKMKQISSDSDSNTEVASLDYIDLSSLEKNEPKSKTTNKRKLKTQVNSPPKLAVKKEKKTELPRSESDKSDDVFKRPHSPSLSPSRSRHDSNSSTNSRFRSQSIESFTSRKYHILYSGLTLPQKNKVERVAQHLNAVITATDWCEGVTHLVCGLAEEFEKSELVATRNLKFLSALMANNFIVSFDWIIDSDKSGRFVDEAKYEIKGVRQYPSCNAPFKSRTAQKKFFDGYKIYFRKCFGSLSEDALHDLVITGGGHVIRTEHELKEFERMLPLFDGKDKLLIVSEKLGTPNTQGGVKFVSIDTFIDAVSQYNSV